MPERQRNVRAWNCSVIDVEWGDDYNPVRDPIDGRVDSMVGSTRAGSREGGNGRRELWEACLTPAPLCSRSPRQ